MAPRWGEGREPWEASSWSGGWDAAEKEEECTGPAQPPTALAAFLPCPHLKGQGSLGPHRVFVKAPWAKESPADPGSPRGGGKLASEKTPSPRLGDLWASEPSWPFARPPSTMTVLSQGAASGVQRADAGGGSDPMPHGGLHILPPLNPAGGAPFYRADSPGSEAKCHSQVSGLLASGHWLSWALAHTALVICQGYSGGEGGLLCRGPIGTGPPTPREAVQG